MRVLRLPPAAGLHWIRDGLQLLGRHFAGLVMVAMGYFFLSLAAVKVAQLVATLAETAGLDGELVARVGTVAVSTFFPALFVGMLSASRAASAGEKISTMLLFEAFRLPRRQFLSLAGLGLFQAAILSCIAAAVGADTSGAAAPAVPTAGGAPAQAQFDPVMLQLAGAAFAIQVLMWYAPLLCAWHGMRAPKALFFSLAAVWRNLGAFALFFLGWLLLSIAILSVLALFVSLLGSNVALFVLVGPVVLLLMAAFQCSWYQTYRSVFVED